MMTARPATTSLEPRPALDVSREGGGDAPSPVRVERARGATRGARVERATQVALVLFSVLFWGWLSFKPFGPDALVPFSDLTLTTAGVGGGLTIMLLALRLRGRDRASWLLIGAGALCWGLGQAVWSYHELVLGQKTPFPSLSDVGYLAMIPLLFTGLVTLLGGAPHREGRLKVGLDAFIAMASIATVSWFVVLGPLYVQADKTWLEKAIGLAYPAGDILYLFALVGGVSRGWIVRRNPIVPPLVLGFGLFIMADLGFTYLTLHDAYTSGNLIDIGWPLGVLFLTYAAVVRWSRGPMAIQAGPSSPRRWLGFAQRYGLYGVVLGVLTLLYASGFGERGLEHNVFLGLALTTVILVLARQLVTVRENERLNHALRSLSDRLEESVAARTASLAALHDLASSLSAASSAGEVAEVGLEALRRAAGGTAAVLYLRDDGGKYEPVAAQPASFPRPAAPSPEVLAQVHTGAVWSDGGGSTMIGWVPVSEGGQVYGCIAILGAGATGAQDTQTLATMGAEFGVAYENRRRFEAARASDARFRSLVQNSSDLITVVDPDGTIRYQSPSIERVFGQHPDEDLGAKVTDRAHPDDAAQVRAFLATAAERPGVTATVEWRRRHHDGSWLSIETIGANLLEVPAVRGIVLNTRDISAHKRAMEDARRAQSAAEAAYRIKAEFLANMSHEIRTPMNAILGMADVLADTPLNPEQQEYVGIFRRAGDALLTLLNDILDLSKVEAGQLELESTEFDPAELAARTVEVLLVQAHTKGLTLSCRVDPEVPSRVRGDPQRLRQVLMNILGNAVKFTERGTVDLRVDCLADVASAPGSAGDAGGATPPDGDAAKSVRRGLRFSVRDTGIGISSNQLEAVFGAFTQADASATRRYGGTGLGLAIVRRMVMLMGGRVWAESQPGQGSTFAFVVPLDAVDRGRGALGHPPQVDPGVAHRPEPLPRVGGVATAASRPDAPPAEDPAGGPTLAPDDTSDRPLPRRPADGPAVAAAGDVGAGDAPGPVRRLLLVDDSVDNRRLIQLYLRRLPYVLEIAEDGQAGVEAFIKGIYDLVLMDIHMPVMDGLAATRAIRAWEHQRGRAPTPVLALTASVMAEDVRQALAAGCDAHVAKPLKKATLLGALAQHTGHQSDQAVAAA